ncbi:Molybdenum cofactor synthesis domain containing protein [Desulfovibrionales bacterium]
MAEIYMIASAPPTITVNIGPRPLVSGACVLLYPAGGPMIPDVLTTTEPLPPLAVGMYLGRESQKLFRVRWLSWLTVPGSLACQTAWVETLEPMPVGRLELIAWKSGFSLAWITLSDKVSLGRRMDTSGPTIEALVAARLHVAYAAGFVLPDNELALCCLLTQLALEQGFDLVLTTGGTGIALRDTTPEAVLSVIKKRLPGFERAMTAVSLNKTPNAMISRAIVGTLGRTFIATLPGSTKAVAETLDAILPAIPHCLSKLQGDSSDCSTAS